MRSAARWTLVATIIASSMTFIDGTVVNVALPALQAELDASIVDVQWVIEAYALFLGALILIGGALGDQFGRKRIFLIGTVVFTAASVACGLAPTPSVLISGRAVQGIGAALLVPGSLAIITNAFDGGERGKAIGIWSGFSAITTAIGPVAGGWLIEHVSWRAAFFINVPLAAVVIVLSLKWMAESHDPTRSRRVDWVGAALAVVGLGGLVLGLLELPERGMSDVRVLIGLVGGALCLVAFVLVEQRVKSPMLPLNLFQSRTFTLANVLTLLLYGALGIAFFLIPLLLIQVRGYTATAAGASIVPMAILMFALSGWSGGLVARIGSRLPLTVGPIVAGIGLALFAVLAHVQSYWTSIFPAIVVFGLGMALTVAPLTTTAMNAVDPRHSGIASGVNNAVARVAGLVAIAVFGVVLSRVFGARMTGSLERLSVSAPSRAVAEKEVTKLAGADLREITSVEERRAVRGAIDDAFVRGFQVVMLCAGALGIVAGAAGAAIRDTPANFPDPKPGA